MKWVLVVGSSVLHGGLLLGLGSIEAKRILEATAISIVENQEPEAPVAPPPPPPPQPVEERAAPRARAKAAPAPAPEAQPTPSASSLDALPDLGLELGGVAGGTSGFAVRAPSAAPVRPVATVARRALGAPARAPLDPCAEAPPKPKLLSLPKPTYTAAARQGGVEGKVRVRIQVDEHGAVVGVAVLESLGFGLDEAAIEAARAAQFEAAIRCGKPVQAAFTIAMRFSAG